MNSINKPQMFDLDSSISFITAKQIELVIKDANKTRINFFNKVVLGKLILWLLRFEERKMQIIKFTNPEEIIIPITSKL